MNNIQSSNSTTPRQARALRYNQARATLLQKLQTKSLNARDKPVISEMKQDEMETMTQILAGITTTSIPKVGKKLVVESIPTPPQAKVLDQKPCKDSPVLSNQSDKPEHLMILKDQLQALRSSIYVPGDDSDSEEDGEWESHAGVSANRAMTAAKGPENNREATPRAPIRLASTSLLNEIRQSKMLKPCHQRRLNAPKIAGPASIWDSMLVHNMLKKRSL